MEMRNARIFCVLVGRQGAKEHGARRVVRAPRNGAPTNRRGRTAIQRGLAVHPLGEDVARPVIAMAPLATRLAGHGLAPTQVIARNFRAARGPRKGNGTLTRVEVDALVTLRQGRITSGSWSPLPLATTMDRLLAIPIGKQGNQQEEKDKRQSLELALHRPGELLSRACGNACACLGEVAPRK